MRSKFVIIDREKHANIAAAIQWWLSDSREALRLTSIVTVIPVLTTYYGSSPERYETTRVALFYKEFGE